MPVNVAAVDGGEDSGGEGEVVVVGVKFDAESRELLTWTLMKLAKPGDRVIALHILDSVTDGTASVLSLVKNFDSLLSAYEGFCNLKQVDLKLKVCRGASVRKILVREAKSNGTAMVVLGTSRTKHKIRPTSVAKFCAKSLPKRFSVFAVSNGKIMFQSGVTPPLVGHLRDNLIQQVPGVSLNDGQVDYSLALIPAQTREEAVPNFSSSLFERSSEGKHGWSILHRLLLPKRQSAQQSRGKKASLVKWVLRLPSWNSSSVVYPDQKQSILGVKDDHSLNLETGNGAIVPVEGPKVAWCPISPSHGFNGFLQELIGLDDKFLGSCRLFSYEELCLATSNFMPENLVGKGGSSHVYQGCLPDGKKLAVKFLKPSEDAVKEFLSEIEIIVNLHHNNIISLFGFCFESNNLLLVYDFLSRGSLEENLHGSKKDSVSFGWRERHKVAVGVAEALDYLHSTCEHPIIHRDVKSSNILLSDDFEPQLSDFGLARVSASSSHKACNDVAGTFGYLAPEYFMHGKVSVKVDVFAFGVVLLELLSGRMPIIGENTNGQQSLVMWAKPILEGGKLSELLDPNISSGYDHDQIDRMALAAVLCIRRFPSSRPPISVVLKLLKGEDEVINWARKEIASKELVMEVAEEASPSSIETHINLALLDIEDGDSRCISSSEQGISLEDYLKGRWTRTSSFS